MSDAGETYDRIGRGYAVTRTADPRIAAAIEAALGDARTVVNVGAGTGSYEPVDRDVTAVEPSATMIAQRPPSSAPVVRASAEALPFADGAFDAALAILTVHHWTDLARGLAELRRVAHRRIVLTPDPRLTRRFWLVSDYLPEVGERDDEQLPFPEEVAVALGSEARISPVPVPHDCLDGFLGAFWRRPEAYLDPRVQAAISVLARLPARRREDGLGRLAEDLRCGRWRERHGDLLELDALDLGYRLVVAEG